MRMCNKRLTTAVQVLCSVLVEDNFGITVHYLKFDVFLLFRALFSMPDCVVVFRYLAVKDITLGNSCVLNV